MRPVLQKTPRYESRKHTSLAKDVPCQFTFPHKCEGGTMPCHANWQQWGKGVWLKCPDWAWAAGCLNAHREIDGKVGATMRKDERQHEWLNAFIGTQNYLWNSGRLKVA